MHKKDVPLPQKKKKNKCWYNDFSKLRYLSEDD